MPIGCIYVLDAVNEVVGFSRGDWFPQEYFFIFFIFVLDTIVIHETDKTSSR